MKLQMSPDIVTIQEFFSSLRERWAGVDIPEYKFRRFYSTEKKIFFDCVEGDKASCLAEVMRNEGYSRFVAFILARLEDGSLRVIDVSFANLGKETLERFTDRYPRQLRPANAMALQLSSGEYIEYLGASYEE
jgi:hypothetical protein